MTRDEKWIHDHFEEIVDTYAGHFIAIANEELFIGDSMKEVLEKAQRKYQDINPSVMRVPHPEDFVRA